MARLNTFVHVGGQVFGPGADVPDEVARTITNPDVWEEPPADVSEPVEVQTSGGQTSIPEAPPRGGKGSGIEHWQEYAKALGIEVPDGAERDDIIALVDAANEN